MAKTVLPCCGDEIRNSASSLNFTKTLKRTASNVCIAFYTLDSFQIYFLTMISEGLSEERKKQNPTKQAHRSEEDRLECSLCLRS